MADKTDKETATEAIQREAVERKTALNLWLRRYNETYGKFFKIPAIGPGREDTELYMGYMDAFMRMTQSWFEYNLMMQKQWADTLAALSETLEQEEVMESSLGPEAFKQAFEMWIQTGEQKFYDLFKTNEFVTTFGLLTRNVMDLYKAQQQLIEDFMKHMPVPTKTDMDTVYKDIYTLKRRTRELETRLKAVEERG